MHRINFGAIRKSVTDAATSVAHGARDLAVEAKEVVERALVAKCLRAYNVKEQVGTSGPKGLWKIYSAEYKTSGGHYPYVSVWILEKKFPPEAAKSSKAKHWDTFLEQQKTGANHLLRLKHPGVLKILEPLEETRTQYIMVTEPIFCSLSDWMSYFRMVPDISSDIRDVVLSELEIKHGLLQVASGLNFLHNDANIAHCGISPESVLLCEDGRWVISNLGFSIQVDFTGNKSINSFQYEETTGLDQSAARPNLQYTAPELVNSQGGILSNISPAADVFSLGLLVYSCLTRVALLSCDDDFHQYQSRVAFMRGLDLTALPSTVKTQVQSMLNPSPSIRPPISSFSGFPYFLDDILLRAIQFLEGMVGKESMQKASFLKDLEGFWSQLDIRIIRNKVLPPLLQELQNPGLQGLIIPFVFKAAGRQSQIEFEKYTLPKLKPILKSFKGESLLIFMTHCDHLAKVMTKKSIEETLLPIFLNALDDRSPKTQDEGLRKAQGILDGLDFHQVKSEILPRVHNLSMRTVSGKVRINSLVLMGSLVPRLGQEEAEKMLQTCQQIIMVDKSPGTLMCVLGVGDSISKHWGYHITSQKILPLLIPLLTAPKLSQQQFNTFLVMIRGMLDLIEEKRSKLIEQNQPVTTDLNKSAEPEGGKITWDTTRRNSSSLTDVGWNGTDLGNSVLNGVQNLGLDSTPMVKKTNTTAQKSVEDDLFGNMVMSVGQPKQTQPMSSQRDFFEQPLLSAFPTPPISNIGTKSNTGDPFASLMNDTSRTNTQQTKDPFADLLS